MNSKNNRSDHYCVIMAGGVGSRFWPLSTEDLPKQFIDILGTGSSLIQQTYSRLSQIFLLENIFVATHKNYVNLVKEHLPDLKETNIIVEPYRKNTAPCLIYSMLKVEKLNPNAKVLVAPSDHIVLKEDNFKQLINEVFFNSLSEDKDIIVTMGITPTRPDTGYGYIESATSLEGINKVVAFREKPNLETAKKMISQPQFTWNSGMFIWSVKTIIKAFKDYASTLYKPFHESKAFFNTPDEEEKITAIYKNCESIAIDYAILEKANNVYVKFADIGWSDLGTWGSVCQVLEKESGQNVVMDNNAIVEDSTNTFLLNAQQGKKIILQGIKDYIIVNTEESLLVCHKDCEQKIKLAVKKIKQ